MSNGANCVRTKLSILIFLDLVGISRNLGYNNGIFPKIYHLFTFCVGTLKHLQHSQYKTLPLGHSTHFSSQIFRLVAEKIFEIVIWVQMESSAQLFNQLKAADPFFLLAGPNVIESEEHFFRMAKHIKTIAAKVGLPLVFKSSFDKANRTSSKSFRGPGMVEGLKILEKVKLAYDIPIVTDVHETIQCEAVGRVADIIQIPAFLCRQVADVTHAIQQPAGRKLDGGGVASGGLRELIPCIARTAVAVGVDGIFMEVDAPVDGPTQWPLRHLEELLEELVAISRVSKGKQQLNIDLTPFRD